MGNTTKSYKEDAEYQKYLKRKNNKGKILVWLVLFGIVAGAGGIGYAVLRNEGIEVVGSSEVSEPDIPQEYEDRMILRVKSDDSETNTVQFNTIYGGTDYDSELSEYKSKSGNLNIDNIIRHLSKEVLVENIFDEQETWLKEAKRINQGYASDVYLVSRASPLTMEMLKGDNQVTIELTCIGVVKDYYGVFWLEGTDFYFVSDERSTRLSKDFFYNQMYHIGKDVYFTFNTQDANIEYCYSLGSTIVYMPNYNSIDFNNDTVDSDTDDVGSYEGNSAFDRFEFCQVTSDDFEVLMSFISKANEKFNFSLSSLSFDDVTDGRARTFSARREDNLTEVLNSSWNSTASSVTSETVGVYTFKGLGYVYDDGKYVALKYSDNVYVILDVSNASRELITSHTTNTFVTPFSLLTSNIRVCEDGGRTYILGYFV